MGRLCELENLVSSLQSDLTTLQNKINDATKVVYELESEVPGINWDFWYANAAPHGPIGNIFTDTVNSFAGTPGHINGAPDQSGTHPTLQITDINMVGNVLSNQGPDQWRLYGYLTFPDDGFFRDNNLNTGETGRVYLGRPGQCCPSLLLQIVADQTTNTPAAQRGIINPILPVTKTTKIPFVILMSDRSAFGGFDGEWSADGVSGWVNVSTCQRLPKWIPRKIPFCDTVTESETVTCFAPPCCEDFIAEPVRVVSGDSVEPTLPLAGRKLRLDNFQDGNGNAPFNLQFGNASNASVNWEALIENVPYATIPVAPSGYTITTAQNPDGTYNHLLTGTSPIPPFGNVSIIGTLPTPPGDGNGISLYCEIA